MRKARLGNGCLATGIATIFGLASVLMGLAAFASGDACVFAGCILVASMFLGIAFLIDGKVRKVWKCRACGAIVDRA